MRIQMATVGPFAENSYLVVDDRTHRAVLIDPGDEADRLVGWIRAAGAGTALDAIWLTHAHVDHIGGIAGVRRVWPVPVHLHSADAGVFARGAEQAAMYGVPFEQPDPPDVELSDRDVLTCGALHFDVLHTPGHSPGHVVFRHGGIVLGGDLLFAGSIGRTDLLFGDPDKMDESLARLCELDDATVVYPGHGPDTTIGHERATNAFLTGGARIARR